MAHRRPVRISVAEMKLYYMYSEWCSWLHSLAEGESWGPPREWAHCATWVLRGWCFVDERSGLSSSCVPFGPEATRVGPGAHELPPRSCHWIILQYWLPRGKNILRLVSGGTPCHQAAFVSGSLESYKITERLSEHVEGPSLSLELNLLQTE